MHPSLKAIQALPHTVFQNAAMLFTSMAAPLYALQTPAAMRVSPNGSRRLVRDYFERADAAKNVHCFSPQYTDPSRWAPEHVTAMDHAAAGLYRVLKPFGPAEIFKDEAVRDSRTFFHNYFGGRMKRGVVHVEEESVGWNGHLEIYDSDPFLEGKEDVLTVVISHELTVPGGHAMYADVIKMYLDYLDSRPEGSIPVRVITIAEPGHGDLTDDGLIIPSPADFSYHPDSSAKVCWRALDLIGVRGDIIHLTESLGLNISWHDMGMAALEGRPPRIEEHILAATSPEQMGFALAALGAQKAILGDRSPLEAIIETLPDRAINYASITKLLHLWLGWNAEIGLHHLCMERLKDPRVTQAIYAVLHHLDGYIEGARLMYHLPVYNYPDIIPVQLLGARDDMVMGEASMNAYAERLRQNYFLDVNLHMEERGGHFAIGKKHPIRQKHVELLIQATERLTG